MITTEEQFFPVLHIVEYLDLLSSSRAAEHIGQHAACRQYDLSEAMTSASFHIKRTRPRSYCACIL